MRAYQGRETGRISSGPPHVPHLGCASRGLNLCLEFSILVQVSSVTSNMRTRTPNSEGFLEYTFLYLCLIRMRRINQLPNSFGKLGSPDDVKLATRSFCLLISERFWHFFFVFQENGLLFYDCIRPCPFLHVSRVLTNSILWYTD